MSERQRGDLTTAEAANGPVLVKVLLFSFALILVFTLVANTLPQIEGEAPRESTVDLGALTMDSFVALGESIFEGKGTCTLCHNNLGRAPDLLALNVARTAREQLEDSRYQGAASDVEDYLRESMIEPGAYVVKGFGKKGTNDAESPMPAVDRAPIQLTDVEIDAVIAFMQAKDGNVVTVALPSEPPVVEAAATDVAATDSGAADVAATVEEAVAKYGCQACHSMMGIDSPVGPDLSTLGLRLGPEEIRRSILDPDAVVTEGFYPGIMPKDFADRMTIRELEMIVRYLAEQKG